MIWFYNWWKGWAQQKLNSDEAAWVQLRLNLKTGRSMVVLCSLLREPHTQEKSSVLSHTGCMNINVIKYLFIDLSSRLLLKYYSQARSVKHFLRDIEVLETQLKHSCLWIFLPLYPVCCHNNHSLKFEISAYFSKVSKHSNAFQWFRVISFVSDSSCLRPNIQASLKPK